MSEPHPSKYDGTYVGTKHLLPGSSQYCSFLPSATIDVTNGKLRYWHGAAANISPSAIINADVQDDGAFDGWALNMSNQKPQHLKGQVIADKIEADTDNPYCKFHLTLDKQ